MGALTLRPSCSTLRDLVCEKINKNESVAINGDGPYKDTRQVGKKDF